MKAPLIIIMLCIGGVFGTMNSAIPMKNKYFAVTSYSLRNRLPRIDKSDKVTRSIQITEMRVRSEISLRYATTSAVTHVHNPGRWSQEYEFSMVLPETAFITGFTMIAHGKSYKAYVKEKEKAQEIYAEAVSEGVGAAHLATTVRDSNNFVVNVNVEGSSTAVFDLRYEEFLVRRNGLYNHVINLYPGAFVPIMEVIVHIKESQKITKLLVPEIRTGNEIDAAENDFQNSKAVIRSGKTDREVTIIFSPDILDQKTLAEIYVNKTRHKSSLDKFIGYTNDEDEYDQDSKVIGQFVVQYDVCRPHNGEILVNDGYFVHFLAPTSLPPLSKKVVFVLDTSYSMLGRKIEQLRNAMETILSDLNPRDYFTIVEFNTHAKVYDINEVYKLSSVNEYISYENVMGTWPFKMLTPTLATPRNIAIAKIIISRLSASGGTNIDEALNLVLTILKFGVSEQSKTDSGSRNFDSDIEDTENISGMKIKAGELEPVIIFLTDGQPTYGLKNKEKIIANVVRLNSGFKRASLYSLAFGEVPDRNFLRELSLKNEGFMRHIYEASDAAFQLHNFYREISSPLLSHVQFLYPSRQVKEGSVSRNLFQTIHEGSEVAVVGEIVENITEIASQVRGYRSTDDGTGRTSYEVSSTVTLNSTREEYFPLERLWAYLNIKQLLDKSITEDYHSNNETSSETKALAIALKYGFVTPLTSLVVVKPNEIKSVDGESMATRSMTSDVSPMSIMPPTILPRSLSFRKTYDERDSVKIDYRRDMNAVALFQSSKTLKVTPHRRPNHKSGSRKKSGKRTKSERKVIHRSNTMRHKKGRRKFKMRSKSMGSRYKTKAPVKSSNVVPTTSTSYIESYSLQGFEWIFPIFERSTDSIVFQENGTQVVLKLLQTVDQPKVDAEDEECFNSIPIETELAAGENEMSGSVCVYITRCSAAQDITVDGYKKSYCFVNERYAGVCCPKSEVLE